MARKADEAHAAFFDENGDHFTYLRVYQQWYQHGCSDAWCKENFVMSRAMRLARNIEMQLKQSSKEAVRTSKVKHDTVKSHKSGDVDLYSSKHVKAIKKAVSMPFVIVVCLSP